MTGILSIIVTAGNRKGSSMKILIAGDIGIGSWLGAADQHAVFQAENDLAASESGSAVHDFHVMPAGDQTIDDFYSKEDADRWR